MEIARHDAVVPYAVIAGANAFHTQDVEEAREWGVRTFCESRLTKIGSQRPLDARLHLRRVRGVRHGIRRRMRRCCGNPGSRGWMQCGAGSEGGS